MQWWNEFWTWVNENQLAATVIGTLIASGLIWLLTKTPKIGPHVRKALKWIWSWRPVSRRGLEKELNGVIPLILAKADENAKNNLVKTLAGAGIAAVEPETARKIESGKKIAQELGFGTESSRAALSGAAPAPAKIPAPRPRWRICRDPDGDGVYVLLNSVKRSVAKEVRLESDDFTFWDGAHFDDLSDVGRATFGGRLKPTDVTWAPVVFTVSWYDENDKQQFATVVLEEDD